MEGNKPLQKDSEWLFLDGEPLLVAEFIPLFGSQVKDGDVESLVTEEPYALIIFEKMGSSVDIAGYITHRDDFKHLWEAFEEIESLDEDRLVIVYWTSRHYRYRISQWISNLLINLIGAAPFPKLAVAIIRKEQLFYVFPLDLISNTDVQITLKALKPVKWWVPDTIR